MGKKIILLMLRKGYKINVTEFKIIYAEAWLSFLQIDLQVKLVLFRLSIIYTNYVLIILSFGIQKIGQRFCLK